MGSIEKIKKELQKSLPVLSDEVSHKIILEFCDFDKTEKEIQLVRLNSDQSKAYSSKVQNISLNWKKMLQIIPDSILTTFGAINEPWLLILACLVIWKNLTKNFSIEIKPIQAKVLKLLWDKREENRNFIKLVIVHSLLENENLESKEQTLNREEIEEVLNDLVKLKCIEIEHGNIWLRESIIVSNSL